MPSIWVSLQGQKPFLGGFSGVSQPESRATFGATSHTPPGASALQGSALGPTVLLGPRGGDPFALSLGLGDRDSEPLGDCVKKQEMWRFQPGELGDSGHVLKVSDSRDQPSLSPSKSGSGQAGFGRLPSLLTRPSSHIHD